MTKIRLLLATITVLMTGAAHGQASALPVAVAFDLETCKTDKWMLLPSSGLAFIRAPIDDGKSYVDDVTKTIDSIYGKGCKLRGIQIIDTITKDTLQAVILADKLHEVRDSDPFTIYLDSTGGLVSEAIKIGNYVAAKNKWTFVGANKNCLSSCVLIYAAGSFRNNYGSIGIHRPFSYEISTEEMEYSQYLEKYDDVMLEIEKYLKRFGVSPALVDMMGTIPSDNIKILNQKELESFGLGGINIARKEFDEAKDIEICGKEFHDKDIKFHAYLIDCGVSDRESMHMCSSAAYEAFPGFAKELERCLEKKR